jgi:aminoglycoside phosphotransferase (APT) family kinase protein
VGRLLGALEEAGFAGAPRHLGTDGKGRDVLTYLEGQTIPRWQGWFDGQVEAAAQLLRGFHDATAGHGICEGHEVVCHGDPGSNNAVFRDGMPVAWIDFDLARPGCRVEDVAYLAWSWCVSSKPSRAPVERQAWQVCLAADAYELSSVDRASLVDRIAERQQMNTAWWAEREGEGAAAIVSWSLRERDFVLSHRHLLRSALD